jgi:pimeloyl-ACP methyl ester carboxylesterase
VPQLWILGGDDLDAPSGETSRRLRMLQAEGKPISLALFPRAGHGIYLSEPAANGEQTSTRQPAGYFAMMRDFIERGRIGPSYGEAVLYGHR